MTIVPPDGTDPGPPLTTCSDDSSTDLRQSERSARRSERSDPRRAARRQRGARRDDRSHRERGHQLGRWPQHRDRLRDRPRSGAGEDPQHQLHFVRSRQQSRRRHIARRFLRTGRSGRHLGVRRIGRRRRRRLREPRRGTRAGRAEKHEHPLLIAIRHLRRRHRIRRCRQSGRVLALHERGEFSFRRRLHPGRRVEPAARQSTARRNSRHPAAVSASTCQNRHGRPASACRATPAAIRPMCRCMRRRAKAISRASPRRAARASPAAMAHSLSSRAAAHRRPTPGLAGITALLNQKTGAAHGNSIHACTRWQQCGRGGVPRRDRRQQRRRPVARSPCRACATTARRDRADSAAGSSAISSAPATTKRPASARSTRRISSRTGTTPLQQSVNLDQIGLTGSWYNPSTSGQGIVMQVVPDYYGAGRGLLFGGWFTFDVSASGGPRWYSVQGEVDASSASATMPIYRSEGGNFAAPPNVGVASIGQATFLVHRLLARNAELHVQRWQRTQRIDSVDAPRRQCCLRARRLGAAAAVIFSVRRLVQPGDERTGIPVRHQPGRAIAVRSPGTRTRSTARRRMAPRVSAGTRCRRTFMPGVSSLDNIRDLRVPAAASSISPNR